LKDLSVVQPHDPNIEYVKQYPDLRVLLRCHCHKRSDKA
jgi:hypothetical protein